MKIKPPYIIFFGDVPDKLAAKTGLGILDWRKEWCIGQSRLDGCAINTELPDMTVTEAVQNGGKDLGNWCSESWRNLTRTLDFKYH